MIRDKYSALWISHSSISDYLRCPRAYYLNNIYRDPKTNHKISLMQPSLALGQIVHAVLDEIAVLPADQRFQIPLCERFEKRWITSSGSKGGFRSSQEEDMYKERGVSMIRRVSEHPGPLKGKAIRLRQELPYYWMSETESIILCGKIDWLEYDERTDSIGILDFKTGRHDEDQDSLQLPIYYLLVSHIQKRPIISVKYWYLERDDEPIEFEIQNIHEKEADILEIAQRIMLARKLGRFVCRTDGCVACRPLEAIVRGEANYIGTDNYNQDVYILPSKS